MDEPSIEVLQEEEEEEGEEEERDDSVPREPVWLLNLPGQVTLKWYPHP
jgi:hypothetical protein